jgi:hypothetical protein
MPGWGPERSINAAISARELHPHKIHPYRIHAYAIDALEIHTCDIYARKVSPVLPISRVVFAEIS